MARKNDRRTRPRRPPGQAPEGPGARATSDVAAAPLAASALGKYLYGIIRTPEPLPLGRIGIGAEPADVYTVNVGDLAAVVSDVPVVVFDPTPENVLAHERVNEAVLETHTVLPMSFGAVFRTREDVVELLRSAADAFHDVIAKLDGKREFGLKVLWDRDAVLREVVADDAALERLADELSVQEGAAYFARVQYGRMVQAALDRRAERYASEIFSALRPLSVASRANKPIGERMIMNAAFLVARDQEAAFDARVQAIAARHAVLSLKYTGPWPPYNFVNLRLKVERGGRAS